MPAGLGVWELLIIFAVLLLLFGAKRLPEMGRSLGHGMREFKDAVSGIGDEPKKDDELQPRTPSATQPSETERVSS
jgi:sec-independent protein translocase protein TatA